MAELDLTSFDAALKEHYSEQSVENMVYKDNPFLAMVRKYEKFGGRNYPQPIIRSNPGGRSATFATAQANKAPSGVDSFLLTRKKDYSLASIDNETLEASQGDPNAFMEAASLEIDGCINAAARSLAISMYGSGDGSRGTVSAEPATATNFTVILTNADDITNYEVDMTVRIYAAGSDTLRTSDGSDDEWVVQSVDRSAGSFVLTGAYDASGDIVATDRIIADGDLNNMVSGLLAWIPATAPTATAFFGVDRSVDSTRLGGVRHNGSTQPIEEALIDAASKVAREGGRPDYCFLSYEKFADLEKALGSKVSYTDTKVGNVGFRGIDITGPKGNIKVIADQNAPSGYAFMLQMDTWVLRSLKKAPRILQTDGLKFLREASADSVEVRVGYYAQLGCNAPGWNCTITL